MIEYTLTIKETAKAVCNFGRLVRNTSMTLCGRGGTLKQCRICDKVRELDYWCRDCLSLVDATSEEACATCGADLWDSNCHCET